MRRTLVALLAVAALLVPVVAQAGIVVKLAVAKVSVQENAAGRAVTMIPAGTLCTLNRFDGERLHLTCAAGADLTATQAGVSTTALPHEVYAVYPKAAEGGFE